MQIFVVTDCLFGLRISSDVSGSCQLTSLLSCHQFSHTDLKPTFGYFGSELFASNVSDESQDISFARVDHVTLCALPNH